MVAMDKTMLLRILVIVVLIIIAVGIYVTFTGKAMKWVDYGLMFVQVVIKSAVAPMTEAFNWG